MGSELSWLEHTPDKREVDGSSPFEPTNKTTGEIYLAWWFVSWAKGQTSTANFTNAFEIFLENLLINSRWFESIWQQVAAPIRRVFTLKSRKNSVVNGKLKIDNCIEC